MKASDQRSDAERTWSFIDSLRGVEFHGPEDLAIYLKKEDVHFTGRDLANLSYVLVTRFGRRWGTNHVPEWLANAFTCLADGDTPNLICDPWAGVGVLIGVLQKALNPQRAIAFTQVPGEMALGKMLVPEVDWHAGDSLKLVSERKEELDLVASILPFNYRSRQPLQITLPSGENREVDNDVGNQLLVAAAMRLGPTGSGLFVVTSSIFNSPRSIYPRLQEFGIGVEAAFALSPGTFAPLTSVSTYLLVVRPKLISRMFVAQLSADVNTNAQIISNFREGRDGGSLEMGRFVEPVGFNGLENIRAADALARAESRTGVPAVRLAELQDIKSRIILGRHGEDFAFEPLENAIYIPLIGSSDVVESPEELTIKPQNYAQVEIDPTRSWARFAAKFLNSDFGRQLREQAKAGVIPKLNLERLRQLRLLVPDMATQRRLIEVESKIATEQTTVMALQNELTELRREMWSNPQSSDEVEQRLKKLAERLSGEVKQHTSETLSQWFESLPFPLASILRAWQATPSQDFRMKHEHLLHFFEATAEFVSVILLSAFSSNDAVFAPHRKKLSEVMRKQNLSFARATFGTWKLIVEYLGKQTRELLRESGKKPEEASSDRSLCGDIFGEPTLSLPLILSRKELGAVLAITNKMRNDWSGHGGVVGQEEAERRNQLLLVEVEKLRNAFADGWVDTQLIHAIHCRPRRGQFENEISIMMGSNNDFLKETRSMSTWLDVERLYLSKKDTGRVLKLLPLVQIGPSPQSARNACYFFNRLESGGARFVSYHFVDTPELTGEFSEAMETIKLLSDN